MRAETVLKYNARVPRYTSYPTAMQFGAEVDSDRYAGWLAAVGEEPLSAYVHVPFCDSLCWYCGCNTQVVRRASVHERYVETLESEIALVRKQIPAPGRIAYLHFGGGTPTVLAPALLGRIMAALDSHFGSAEDAVRAIEIDPRGLTAETAAALQSLNVKRASLGVQDLNETVQRAINRVQPWDQVRESVRLLRRHGVDDLNLDLMYGLPHQTMADLLRTVDGALELAPERVALFGYAHVPWMKKHQRLIDEASLPDALSRLDMAQAAHDRLTANGYRAVGMDHFVRDGTSFAAALEAGRIRRNFQGYTDDTARVLLGFGASAIGDLGHGMVQNESDVRAYTAAVAAGRLATARGVARSADDRLRGAVIEQLMCRNQVALDEVCAAHGRGLEALAGSLEALQPFEDDGIITRDGARIAISEHGRPVVRAVCAAFDSHLAPQRGAHSAAV